MVCVFYLRKNGVIYYLKYYTLFFFFGCDEEKETEKKLEGLLICDKCFFTRSIRS